LTVRANTSAPPVPFDACVIDDAPELLQKSFALRYQVYCLERRFLPAADYPDGLEIDEFDRHSIHVGAVDGEGQLAGTARIVRVSTIGLPIFHHCTTFPHERAFSHANTHIVEVGRLAVSRTYRRRAGDAWYGTVHAPRSDDTTTDRREQRRRGQNEVCLTLLKALYQATKRLGVTEWLAGMEKSLERLLAQHGFSFQLIGPETDYFGLVGPYRLDLKKFDDVIVSGRFPELAAFVEGLEPQFGPQPPGMSVRSDA
jgi:N-acyl amino acid synthase of PEP-CTERM/exosortase system